MAMQTYLATLGSAQGRLHRSPSRNADGKPVYIGGVLGLLERNTMRYYLAIDAYLAAYSLPAAEQFEKRIREWYASTERYAAQLHEMEQNEYLDDEAQGDAAPAAELSAAAQNLARRTATTARRGRDESRGCRAASGSIWARAWAIRGAAAERLLVHVAEVREVEQVVADQQVIGVVVQIARLVAPLGVVAREVVGQQRANRRFAGSPIQTKIHLLLDERPGSSGRCACSGTRSRPGISMQRAARHRTSSPW